MTRSEILDAAKRCVCGQREQDYGPPEDNFQCIAELWSVYKKTPFTSEDVAVMMALLKIARIATGTATEDSWVDLAGYAACGGEIGTDPVAVKTGPSFIDAATLIINLLKVEKRNCLTLDHFIACLSFLCDALKERKLLDNYDIMRTAGWENFERVASYNEDVFGLDSDDMCIYLREPERIDSLAEERSLDETLLTIIEEWCK